MRNFKNLVRDNGLLSDEGKKLLEPFINSVEKLLYSPEMRGATEEQLKELNSIMVAKINDLILQKNPIKNR